MIKLEYMKKNLFKILYKKTKLRILKSYLSVNYSPKKFELSESDNCLCLAPHQDDETIGMGGTLVKYNKLFDVICLTNGAKGFKYKSHDEAVEIRKKEFEKAMEIAEVRSSGTLDIEDRALIDNYKKFSQINIESYDYIFLPNIIDQHKDHKATSALLYQLLKEKKHKNNLRIVFYEVWSPLSIATAAIDISENIETKKRMLLEYKSQCEQRSYYEASIGIARYRGLAKKMEYAEAFWTMSVNEFMELAEEVYTLLK